MAQLISGKALAAEVKQRVAQGVAALRAQGHPVCLRVFLVGDDPASATYVAGKERDCAECGITSQVVLGRSNIVGKPMALLLLRENATVTVCHSRTENLAEVCRQADILVAAVGKAGFVTADMVKPGAAVIDVGINRNAQGKLCGDVDFAAVQPLAGAISPVPGGVGLMTRAMLMENTLLAARMAAGQMA